MIVAEAFFGVAPGTGDGKVVDVVGSSVMLGDDVLECGIADGGSVETDCQPPSAMNALALEHRDTVAVTPLEGTVAVRRFQKQPLPAICQESTVSECCRAKRRVDPPRNV